eukprot:2213677-Ditylum_brightwellii.AAC.1
MTKKKLKSMQHCGLIIENIQKQTIFEPMMKSSDLPEKSCIKPTSKQVTEDLILALRNFKRSCKWRELWHNSRIKQLNSANPNAPEHTLEKQDQGLKTSLQTKVTCHGPPGSTQLENFLKDIK